MAERDKPPGKGKPGSAADPSKADTSTFGELPRRGASGPIPVRHTTGNLRVTAAGPARNTSPPAKVAQSGPHTNPLGTRLPPGLKPAGGVPGGPPAPPPPKAMTSYQKNQLSSGFSTDERQKRLNSVIGNTREGTVESDEDEEPTSLGLMFDGETPAPQLTGRDLWKAVQAPVQSREGRRSIEMLTAVLAQFAVGNNPRYDPDAPGKPRGHIYLWDVSRAMNCEVPHFVGAKELSLAQTVDWVRHEGPMRGWVRGGPEEAILAAQAGMLAVAMPKDIKQKQVAIVLPEDPDPNGKPRVAGAGLKKGSNLALNEAIGVFLAEYFIHA
jgi:hypothetical protein